MRGPNGSGFASQWNTGFSLKSGQLISVLSILIEIRLPMEEKFAKGEMAFSHCGPTTLSS